MVEISPEFERLADHLGVGLHYHDMAGRPQRASMESLLAVFKILGIELASVADAKAALAARERAIAERGVEPVIVAWGGKETEFEVTISAAAAASLEWAIGAEEDAHRPAFKKLHAEVVPGRADSIGYATLRARTPGGLRTGYHRMLIAAPGRTFETLVISAPTVAWVPEPALREKNGGRLWGAFLPLYALQSKRNWGAGDFTDLAELSSWLRELGGRVVGTLPLLATYLDEPFDPSPYSPVSRLFWNEFYIDIESIPDLKACPEARNLVSNSATRAKLDSFRATEHVEYCQIMALKRRVLELLASDVTARKNGRFAAFMSFVESHPALRDYAAFRATYERQRRPWQNWPAPQREGRLSPGDYDEAIATYHCYAQWIASEQLGRLASEAHAAGDGLYLDLPVGVRGDGYDVWRHRGCYAAGASAGCPPDPVFTKGQNWGFSPLHPDGIRNDGYRHFREFIGLHMRMARILRIDHVMGLHRLYWIPWGLPAAGGVYVRYRADELYAILCVESHRHQTSIIGEDLGTVPPEVGASMNRRGFRRMYIVQYEMQDVPESAPGLSPVRRPPALTIASANTHDMPMFAAWWQGDDIGDRKDLGLIDHNAAEHERQNRERLKRSIIAWLLREGWLQANTRPENQATEVLQGLFRYLAASPAETLLVNLEDLWQETRPQNVPGTWMERPNWKRKARLSLEQFQDEAAINAFFRALDRLRRNDPAT